MPVLIRHLWQVKTVFFLHLFLMCAALLELETVGLGWAILSHIDGINFRRLDGRFGKSLRIEQDSDLPSDHSGSAGGSSREKRE
jgi:hypothetical protein